MVYTCFKCHNCSPNTSALVTHFRLVHGLGPGSGNFTCHQEGCYRTFKHVQSLKRHLQRSHAALQEIPNPVPNSANAAELPEEVLSGGNDDIDDEHNADDGLFEDEGHGEDSNVNITRICQYVPQHSSARLRHPIL